MSLWDDPGMQPDIEQYVKFERVGDAVAGKITEITKKKWDDGSTCPQLVLDTADGEKTVTCGQTRLKIALSEQRPEVGDSISIKYTLKEPRPGGKTLKHFEVVTTRAPGRAAVLGSGAPAGDGPPPF